MIHCSSPDIRSGGLPGRRVAVRVAGDLRTRQAVDGDLSHSEFLLRLLTDEVERRDAKQIDTRLRRASFEHHKSLEDFDFTFNPKIPKAKISTSSPRACARSTQ